MTARRYALRDDQWERIKDLLPGRAGYVRCHGIHTIGWWSLQCSIATGQSSQPRDLPTRFDDFRVVHTRTMSMAKNRDVGASISALGKRCRQ